VLSEEDAGYPCSGLAIPTCSAAMPRSLGLRPRRIRATLRPQGRQQRGLNRTFSSGAAGAPGWTLLMCPLGHPDVVGVSTEEEVTNSPAPPVGDATLNEMVRPIVQQMAALAQRMKIAQTVVRGVMVEVSSSKHHPSGAVPRCVEQIGPSSGSVTAVTPGAAKLVIPTAIRQAAQSHLVGPATSFTATLRSSEAYACAQFSPVRRIERAQLAANWHNIE
jgi:hypothetical protein